MFQLLWNLVAFAIDKWFGYKLKQADNALEREKIKAETEQSKDKWKAVILTSTGAWWFQLFFIIPLALWFTSVVFYSMFWCADCIYPQTWTIAALPSPLDDWAGAIIAFLFLTNAVKR
jgi:hypothetical protein